MSEALLIIIIACCVIFILYCGFVWFMSRFCGMTSYPKTPYVGITTSEDESECHAESQTLLQELVEQERSAMEQEKH